MQKFRRDVPVEVASAGSLVSLYRTSKRSCKKISYSQTLLTPNSFEIDTLVCAVCLTDLIFTYLALSVHILLAVVRRT